MALREASHTFSHSRRPTTKLPRVAAFYGHRPTKAKNLRLVQNTPEKRHSVSSLPSREAEKTALQKQNRHAKGPSTTLKSSTRNTHLFNTTLSIPGEGLLLSSSVLNNSLVTRGSSARSRNLHFNKPKVPTIVDTKPRSPNSDLSLHQEPFFAPSRKSKLSSPNRRKREAGKAPLPPLSPIATTRPLPPSPALSIRSPLFTPPYMPKPPRACAKSSGRPPKQPAHNLPLAVLDNRALSPTQDIPHGQKSIFKPHLQSKVSPIALESPPNRPPAAQHDQLKMSPVSSVTASNGSSRAATPSSSPGARTAKYKSCTRGEESRILPYAALCTEIDVEAQKIDLNEVFRVSRTAATRSNPSNSDAFEEDDYSDSFDIRNSANIDIDAAMDEYIVFSRRYDSGIKMRREVRDALPKKKSAGLWARISSELSSEFANDSVDIRGTKSESSPFAMQEHLSSPQGAGLVIQRDWSSIPSEKVVRTRSNFSRRERRTMNQDYRKMENAQAAANLVTDDFLKLHGLDRTVRRRRKTNIFLSCRRFFKSLVFNRPKCWTDEDDDGAPWDGAHGYRPRIADN